MGLFDLFSSGSSKAADTSSAPSRSPIFLEDTLQKKKREFVPLRPGVVKTYSCGPTVYDRQHIGNLSAFIFSDVLRRVLECNGYTVKQVINITDFGHLVSDADDGEDKMAKGLKREKKKFTLENMLEMGKKYAGIFIEDLQQMNVNTEAIQFTYASDFIEAQIALIRTLEEKGYAYKIPGDGMYFDVSRFPTYGELGGIDLEALKAGARVTVVQGKRSPADFALWKFNDAVGWDSPWGKGFPGWHIECSAMIRTNLGEQIDIHTGGPEHIAIHHNNEIAQSEAAFGKRPFVGYWLHRAWIQIEGTKISKSLGNTYFLSDVTEKGFHPLSLRYWFLTSHYRTPANFTWDTLAASQRALLQLVQRAAELADETETTPPAEWLTTFTQRINDDIDTAGALASVWELMKSKDVEPGALKAAFLKADAVLALKLFEPDELMLELLQKEFGTNIAAADIPADVQKLMTEREAARLAKNWTRADEIRDELKKKGFEIKDTAEGAELVKK